MAASPTFQESRSPRLCVCSAHQDPHPPKPPKSQPLERYLWNKHADLIDWLREFKSDAFGGRMGWSIGIRDCYLMLQLSPLLTQEEKKVVADDAETIIEMLREQAQEGIEHTSQEISARIKIVHEAFFKMIDKDAVSKGKGRMKQARENMERTSVGIVCYAHMGNGKCRIIRQKNLDAFGELDPNTELVFSKNEDRMTTPKMWERNGAGERGFCLLG